jgi:hypothetical protein
MVGRLNAHLKLVRPEATLLQVTWPPFRYRLPAVQGWGSPGVERLIPTYQSFRSTLVGAAGRRQDLRTRLERTPKPETDGSVADVSRLPLEPPCAKGK